MSIMAGPEAFLRNHGVKNPKIVYYGVAALAAGIIIAFIVDKAQKAITTPAGLLSGSNGLQTTLTDAHASLIAQNLLGAMDRWGTDEQAIIDNLKKAKTSQDLVLINQKFGSRPYNIVGLSGGDTTTETGMKNLNGWLRQELSGNDLLAVKAIYDRLGVIF